MFKKLKRQLAMLLCLVLCLSLFPAAAFAEEEVMEPAAEEVSEVVEETAATDDSDTLVEEDAVFEEPEDIVTEEANDSEISSTEQPSEENSLYSGKASANYAPDSAELDNEQLLNAYAEKVLGLTQEENMRKVDPTRGFSDAQKQVYTELKAYIAEVAAGNEANPTYTVEFADPGIATWPAEHPVTEENASEEAGAAQDRYLNLGELMYALLASCPYELYWYDKTVGVHIEYYYYSNNNGTVTIPSITYYFAVASEYSDGNGGVQTNLGSSIHTAVSNANSIVDTCVASGDYNRLRYYKDQICGLVSYNDAAADDDDTPYGNPWQIIWVFDGNEGTDVVCEGYSKAFQYLCDLTAQKGLFASPLVDCWCVSGKMDDGNHMWNIVTMDDGARYLADITNCDTDTIGYPDLLFLKGYDRQVDGGYVYCCGIFESTYLYDNDALLFYTPEELSLSSADYGENTTTTSGTWGTLEWTLDDTGTLTISGNGAMEDFDNGSDEAWHPYYENINNIILSSGITSIGNNAFIGCYNLKSIMIPDSVSSIGFCAFFGCSSMTSFTIPENVTSIGGGIFQGCRSMTRVTILGAITSISDSAFENCRSLTEITIPNSVTSIGYNSFYNCTSLTDITIPDSVTSIDEYAFDHCCALESITIPNRVTSIGEGAFCNCDNLLSVIISGGLTNIDSVVFSNCYSLKSITIPAGVASIGSRAFEYCFDLKEITFLGAPPAINGSAFKNVTADAYYPANKGWTAGDLQHYGGKLTWKVSTVPVDYSGTWGALEWTLDAAGTLTISGNGEMNGFASESSEAWLQYKTDINTVILTSGVKSI